MPRKNSEFVKAGGAVFQIIKALAEAVHARGGSDDDLRRVLSDKTLADKVAEILVGKREADTYPVTIDYGKSVEEMIEAGHYDWVHPNINVTNFPVSDTGVVEVNLELVHLGRSVSSEVVLAHLEANGLRPATFAESLAFGVTYPEIQRQFPVVVLGSSWGVSVGLRDGPYLVRCHRGRGLYLDWCEGGWDDICRFLALRK